MKKILVIEDDASVQRNYAELLKGKVEVVAVHTLHLVEATLEKNSPFDLVVMDACVDDVLPDTYPLVKKIRESFDGPMIAASSSSRYRKELLAVGCSHEAEKSDVPALVLALLEIE